MTSIGSVLEKCSDPHANLLQITTARLKVHRTCGAPINNDKFGCYNQLVITTERDTIEGFTFGLLGQKDGWLRPICDGVSSKTKAVIRSSYVSSVGQCSAALIEISLVVEKIS